MPFDASSGPPASQKQLEYLEALLKKAGFSDYREARGPLGLTQKQGRGKFTKREASTLIEQLLGDDDDAASVTSPSNDEPSFAGAAEPGPFDDEPSSPAPAARPARPAGRVRRAGQPVASGPESDAAVAATRQAIAELLAVFSDDALATELHRRGWTTTPPP